MLYSCIVLQSEREINRKIKLADLLHFTNIFQNLARRTCLKSATLGMSLKLVTDSRKLWNLEDVMQPIYAKF
jgi:hypothetical protein